MKTPLLKSYLVPRQVEDPQVLINGKKMGEEPIRVEHWHQADTTKITAILEIDLEAAQAEMELGQDSVLGLYITSFSKLTKFKVISNIVTVVNGTTEVNLDVGDRKAGGYQQVEVVLVCLERGSTQSDLAPNKFDVLETWRYLAELEGEKPRANVQLVRFEGIKEKALWEINSTAPNDLDEWKFASVSTAIQVNLSASTYAKIQSDPLYQIQYCVDFMWEALLLIAQDEDALTLAMSDLSNCPGSLIRTSAHVVHSVFGKTDPALADVLHAVQNKPSHVRAILQDRAARLVGAK